ncbi:MAG: DNA polymerase [Rhizobacter sp.]|nr:DNA polymerase [Chlorobiales bacterium]
MVEVIEAKRKAASLAKEFLKNEKLYGKDDEENLIALHQVSDTHIKLYKREAGEVAVREERFYPFFFLSNAGYLKGFERKHWLTELAGDNFYKYLVIFERWKDYRAAMDFAAETKRKMATGNEGSISFSPNPVPEETSRWGMNEIYSKGDAASQYLFQTGKTLFKGMAFEELRRLQLDIETYYDKAAQRSSKIEIGRDRIIIISLSDNTGWEQVVHTHGQTEKEMLEELVQIICERNPDVIEGHNIFSFDLPYIIKRCEMFGVPFKIGRDGTVPRCYPSSIRFAERTIDYPYCDIAGRHVVDTLFLVQYFDMAKRAMPSYNLKETAKYFGFASDTRTYVDYKDIADLWDNNPEKLIAYALDDVREANKLSERLSGSNFYMTQMMPFSYGQVSKMGPAAKIEALFVREYLRHKHSIPKAKDGQQDVGGFTEVFLKGVLGPVMYADVDSLYPSIMLSFNVCPASDERRVFPEILTDLRKLRFEAKGRMKAMQKSGDEDAASAYDAMQNSFKVLINSMYGYLGFRAGIFNDYEQADKVTTTGREIARKMIMEFEKRGSRVIEVDTDGIYLIPPPHVQTEAEEQALVKEVSNEMVDGIDIGYDGRFKKMISYMKKNYVLLGYDGKLKMKGSSLVSRSGEKFGREFVRKCFELLLTEDIAGLHELYCHYRNRILDKQMDVSEFSRQETLKSPMDEYLAEVKAGKRGKAITYEIALKQKMEITKGDRIVYYLTGSDAGSSNFDRGKLASDWNPKKPDQNIYFYLKRLDEFTEKFKAFFTPTDFSRIFTADELFGFSPEGIEVIREIQHRSTSELDEEVPF